VSSIYAPNGTLRGSSSFGQIQFLTVNAAVNATINLGSGFQTTIGIANVTNTNLIANQISNLSSKQWLNTDGGNYSISAESIAFLNVPGTFDENLSLASKGYSLFFGKIGKAIGSWGLGGSVYKLSMGTPGPNWQLQCNGLVRSLAIKGNLSNQITAAAISTLTVSGITKNSTIETNAGFSPKFQQIGHMAFGGAVSGTVIFSAGNIGTISAPSFNSSRIYAGVNLAVAQSGGLAASASDISAAAKIGSITLGKGANAFSNALITADIIGSLQLGKINTVSSGTLEGVSAHIISSFSGVLVPGGVFRAGRAQLKNAAALAAYEAKAKLALGAFELNLF